MLLILLLSIIFDNLIIYGHIVKYNTAKLIDLYIFKAPIEDFAYSIVAAIIVPIVWERFKK